MFAWKRSLVLLLLIFTGCASGRNHRDHFTFKSGSNFGGHDVTAGRNLPGRDVERERAERQEEAFVRALRDSLAESIASHRLKSGKAHDRNDVAEAQLYAFSARFLVEVFWNALKEVAESGK